MFFKCNFWFAQIHRACSFQVRKQTRFSKTRIPQRQSYYLLEHPVMQFHVEKCFFALARLFGRFSPSFCICSSPESFIRAKFFRQILRKNAKIFRTNDHSCEILICLKGGNKISFFLPHIIIRFIPLFISLPPETFIRAKFFHVINISVFNNDCPLLNARDQKDFF